MLNDKVTLETNLAFLKMKLFVGLPYNLAIEPLSIYPTKSYIHKHLYMNVHNNFIRNNPKLEMTHICGSIFEWFHKL
jgi:hypothetical protein